MILCITDLVVLKVPEDWKTDYFDCLVRMESSLPTVEVVLVEGLPLLIFDFFGKSGLNVWKIGQNQKFEKVEHKGIALSIMVTFFLKN